MSKHVRMAKKSVRSAFYSGVRASQVTRQHAASGNHSSVRSAFTLIEVLLVIALLVALGAMVLPKVMGSGDKAKIGLTQAQIDGLRTALDLFKLDVGRYPTTDEGLKALWEKDAISDDELAKKWDEKGYVAKNTEFKDSWSRELNYRCPGEHNEDGYDLWSNGPDGEEGTDDDVKNWTTK